MLLYDIFYLLERELTFFRAPLLSFLYGTLLLLHGELCGRSCEGRLRESKTTVYVYTYARQHVCATMRISRMPIGTRGKFVGTRGRRGSRLRGGCSGKVVPR